MNNSILSQRLKNERKKHNLTQKELAKALNVASSVIAGAETKRGISKGLAKKLASFFKTDVEYWINENSEKEFITEYDDFETIQAVVYSMFKNNLLSCANIDRILNEAELNDNENKIHKLLFNTIKFDIEMFLKKLEQKKED